MTQAALSEVQLQKLRLGIVLLELAKNRMEEAVRTKQIAPDELKLFTDIFIRLELPLLGS